MKKCILLFSILYIILAFLSCNNSINEPEELSSEIIIDNISSPIKSAYCFPPVQRKEPISHIILIVTENNKALLLNLSYKNSGNKVAAGSYKCTKEINDKTYTFMGWTATVYFPNSIEDSPTPKGTFYTSDYSEIIQGEVNISIQNNDYILFFEGTNEEGSSIKLFYKGIFKDRIEEE